MSKLTWRLIPLFLIHCVMVASAQDIGIPVAIKVQQTNGANRSYLAWPAESEAQYDVLTRINLAAAPWLFATNTSIIPTNLIGSFQHSSTNDARFFRIAKRDLRGPAISSRYPATNGVGVGRFANLTLTLTDETGVDTNRFILTLNGLTLTNGSTGVIATPNLFQYLPGTNAWGNYGATAAVSFVYADLLGNATTSSWTFSLEVLPVVTNGIVHLPPPASFKNSAMARAATKNGANFADGLTIISFETNLIVFSYTGTSHGLFAGAILVSHDPNRIYYRRIIGLTNDAGNHLVTTYTTDILLTDLIQDGTYSPEVFLPVTDGTPTLNWQVSPSFGIPISYQTEYTALQFEVGPVRVTPGIMSVNLQGKAQVSGTIKNWKVVAFDASIESQFDAQIRARIEFLAAAAGADATIPLLAPITIARVGGFIGVVPVWVDLAFSLDLGLELDAEASVVFETGLDAHAESNYRLGWRPGGVTSSYNGSFYVVPVPLVPSFQLSAEAFLYLRPKLSARLYSLVGVYADYRRGPDLEAKWNAGDPQCEITLYDRWSIDAGLSVAGVDDSELPNITLLQEKRTVATWYWPGIAEQAPVFTRHPSSVTAASGSTVTLDASASGNPAPTYQWFQNGQPIPFKTHPMLSFTMGSSAAGTYYAKAQNRIGSRNSSTATVSVTVPVPPTIVQHPVDVNVRIRPDNYPDVAPFTNATFTVSVASANPPINYLWRVNGTNITATNIFGINSATLLVSNVVMDNFGAYSCQVTDGYGSLSSASATLYPLVRPRVWIGPPNPLIVTAGQPVPVSVVISNGWPPPFGYQWRSNAISIATRVSNSKTNFFVIPSAYISTNAISSTFRVVVTNRAATIFQPAQSASFTLTTLLDTDRDGIPDGVETALGLNPNLGSDAMLDLDGDGQNNLDEYRAGTGMNNPDSYLRVDVTIAGHLATLTVDAVSNRTYSVQSSDAGPASWRTLANLIMHRTNRIETIRDSNWTPNRAYRVVLPAQP